MSKVNCQIVALTSGGPHAWIILNALNKHFGNFPILVDQGESASIFWKRRLKILGPVTVAGQIAAMALAKITKPLSKARQEEVLNGGFSPLPEPDLRLQKIVSVNSPQCQEALVALAPKVVFVISAPKLNEPLLNSIPARFVNYHSGLNPAYRGLNGGYYALAAKKPEHFASTMHFIDKGIDTGPILATQRVIVSPKDNIHTYVPLMAQQSVQMVINTIESVLLDNITINNSELPSRQYYHPNIFEYFKNGILANVW
jgi:hypothetical protein